MARKRAKKGQLAKRSRGRSKIERDLLKKIKGKAAPPSSSTSPPPSSSSSTSSGSSDLEAARPKRKRAREVRVSSPPPPLSDSDDQSDLARAVSQVTVQVGQLCSFLMLGVRRLMSGILSLPG